MTDYTQLIERLKQGVNVPYVEVRVSVQQAATALEALQARAKDSYMNGYEGAKNECRDAYNALRKERDALQARVKELERRDDLLSSACDKMRINHSAEVHGYIEERDTLAEKLAALEGQEPVAWITPSGEGFRLRFTEPTTEVALGWVSVYLAAGAQAQPLTERLHDSDCATNNEPAYPAGPCDCRQSQDYRDGWNEACLKFGPQRKPLSELDIERLADLHLKYQIESYTASCIVDFVRAVEAAHKIGGSV